MNTIKNLQTIETISNNQANCVKGGLTDTRKTVKPSTLGAIVVAR